MKIDKEELRQAMEEALNQEVEELLQSTADNETIEHEAETAMERMDWKRIYRETDKQKKKHLLAWSKVAMIFLLVIVAGSVSVYAATKIFRPGIQWIVKQGEGEDDFLFELESPMETVIPTGEIETKESASETENVTKMAPAILEVYYEPSYLPDGYELCEEESIMDDNMLHDVLYVKKAQGDIVGSVSYSQNILDTAISIDNINMKREIVDINGWKGQLNYKKNKKSLIWATDEYSFMVHGNGEISKEEVLKIARSMTPVK